MSHPYRGLPSHQFWTSAVSGTPSFDVDPMVEASFRIARGDRVATAGSCFAQHVSRALQAASFNFFQAEPPPDNMTAQHADERNYNLYSARFGNVYTARQLVQLFDRAFGRFQPQADAWGHPRIEGAVVDPFRPQIEPDGFASVAALHADRKAHLASVRRMFTELDVFVFTLGLTESWRHRGDGAALPLAPGVAGGTWPNEDYEFHNSSVDEVRAELNEFIDRLREVNPGCRIIFTVSPVPLAATYEPRHVLTSTVYSKAVLRVAAEEAARTHEQVLYFPSFEIVTGQHQTGRYWEDDLRSVRPAAVAHVMRVFLRNLTEGGQAERSAEAQAVRREAVRFDLLETAKVLCDEDEIRQD